MAAELLELVKKRGIAGVVATVRGPLAGEGLADEVFQPAVGDVASLLLTSGACDRVLEEIAGVAWMQGASKEVGPVVDHVILLSWLIHSIQPSTSVEVFLERTTTLIDWEAYEISDDLLRQEYGTDTAERTRSLCEKMRDAPRSSMISSFDGRHAVELLSLTLERFRPRGLRADQTPSADQISGMLRAVYDFSDFERDPIYWRMRGWERMHPKYSLLRGWRLMDPLSVVWDQRYWRSDLETMLRLDPGKEGLSAFKLDLDNFKSVNEVLGHAGGDEAIRTAGRAISRTLQGVAEIYRRGGDEFVALAPGLRQPASAKVADKLRGAIEDAFLEWCNSRGLAVFPTASIGLVDVRPGSSCEAVVKSMDEAQLRAKEEGKNRVVVLQCPPN